MSSNGRTIQQFDIGRELDENDLIFAGVGDKTVSVTVGQIRDLAQDLEDNLGKVVTLRLLNLKFNDLQDIVNSISSKVDEGDTSLLATITEGLSKVYKKDEVYTKQEVTQKIKDIIGLAPEALDTLYEIANALNNDPNFATTVIAKITSVESALNAEIARAKQQENTLDGKISAEANRATSAEQDLDNRKVEKETGKGLSTNDLTDERRANLEDCNTKKHTHDNKGVLDAIIQSLVDKWNSAYSHISDTIKHITSAERTNWNDANSKKHTHDNKSTLDGITEANIADWNNKLSKSGGSMTGTILWDGLTASKDLLNATGSTDWAKISYIINGSDNCELRNTIGDDTSTKFTWYGNNTKLMDLQPTGNGTTISGANLSINGNITATNFNGTVNGFTLGKTVPANAVFTDTNTWRGVQDNLTSTATDQSLSANQGKVLKGLIDSKANTSHNHDDRYYTETECNTKFATKEELSSGGYGNMLKSIYDTNNSGVVDNAEKLDGKNYTDITNYVDDAIDNLSIGGRNLILKSDKFVNYNSFLGTGNSKEIIIGVDPFGKSSDLNKLTVSTSTSNAVFRLKNVVNSNDEYTFSGWYKSATDSDQTFSIDICDIESTIFTSNNLWQKFIVTAKVDNYNSIYNFADIEVAKGSSVLFYNLKLEKGNLATDWTPAPEDAPTKLSQLTNDTGYITQADVDTSQNHVHANKATLDGITADKVNSWDNGINKINNLQIGGNNLILNSDFRNSDKYWGVSHNASKIIITDFSSIGTGAFPVDVERCIKVTSAINQSYGYILPYKGKVGYFELDSEQKYTISFYIYVPSSNVGSAEVRMYYDNKGWNGGNESTTVTERDKWVRKSLTFTSNKTYASSTILAIGLRNTPSSGGDVAYIANVKLEKGNIATDWTPSSNDIVNNSIKATQDSDGNQINTTYAKKSDITTIDGGTF